MLLISRRVSGKTGRGSEWKCSARCQRARSPNGGSPYKNCSQGGPPSLVTPTASSCSGRSLKKPHAACSSLFSSSASAAKRLPTNSAFHHPTTKSRCGCERLPSRSRHPGLLLLKPCIGLAGLCGHLRRGGQLRGIPTAAQGFHQQHRAGHLVDLQTGQRLLVAEHGVL